MPSEKCKIVAKKRIRILRSQIPMAINGENKTKTPIAVSNRGCVAFFPKWISRRLKIDNPINIPVNIILPINKSGDVNVDIDMMPAIEPTEAGVILKAIEILNKSVIDIIVSVHDKTANPLI